MIPVLKPKLPDSDAILPYMRQIDANRWYGNFGPLVQAFEKRVADMLHTTPDQALMVANGTLGITVALQAYGIERGTICLMPSWTFTATAAAVLAAGLTPCFIDVDHETQTFTPLMAEEAMKTLDRPVGAVIVVSPFGTAIDTAAWDRFSEETNIPCVIDAAAAFDAVSGGAMTIGKCPIMVSLHATKVLGVGEGGLMLTRNNEIAFRMRRIINFGFENDRMSHRIAINAKPCEYNAAVGMAALDNWPKQRAGWEFVHSYYRAHLEKAGVECWMPPELVTSTCNIIYAEQAVALAHGLKARDIDSRRWWETGCHTHPAYRSFQTIGSLPNTRWLSKSVLGIPAAWDMTEENLKKVCDAVLEILATPKSYEQASLDQMTGSL